jgi:hypothetical protein
MVTMPQPPLPLLRERKGKPFVPLLTAAMAAGAVTGLLPRKTKDNDGAAGPSAAPGTIPPPPLLPRKPKDNDDAPASAGAGGSGREGMNKNPIAPTLIVPVAIIFPPPDGTVVLVVLRAADVRKLKADPVITNPPSLVGGGGVLCHEL